MTFADAYPSVRRVALPSDAKLRALWDAFNGDVPGDVAELGVYRGGTARLLALRCPDRAVHLFDTFAGIPWDGYDARIDGHRPGEWTAGLDGVREYLSDCPNVRFHPGLFPHTTAGLDDCRFALVHLDADLYASTLAGLKWFWPRMNVGGRIVLDDWNYDLCRGVTRAVMDVFGIGGHEMTPTAPHQLTITKD